SGHAHNYQRFTRTVTSDGKSMQVPYIVAGNGGHNIHPLEGGFHRQPGMTPPPRRAVPGDTAEHHLTHKFNGLVHPIITATNRILTLDLIGTKTESSEPVDSVTVDLTSNKITHETAPFKHPANGERQTKHMS